MTKADASFPKGHRVSLVLEQYRVPPGLREFTMHFEIVEGKDYERVSDKVYKSVIRTLMLCCK